ncbi:MAG: tRNA dihydrouridine synthase DusB [Acidaminococcaceae bacterium]|nr:tRNA dihydrouridine synthase DusB [Acidaminococcaceae bacterium]
MQIGKLKMDTPLALAPMAGVTDLPYRVICREQGCGLTVSEMVSAKGLLYKNVKTFSMLRIAASERPTAIQLFGSSPDDLARAAKIVEETGADIVDFNMGCPVHKIVSNGEGSALMKTPQLAYEILAAMVEAVNIPVTAKFRAGWDSDHLNAPEIAVLAEKAGVAAVAIHGRTREQFYSGNADWNIIKQVKQAVKIPVFGNGDIMTVNDGLRMLQETGCDGIMLGRGADCNPWIFAGLKAALRGETLPAPVEIITRFAMIKRHLQDLIVFKGEVIALKEMRRHVNMYLKGLPKSATFRVKFNQIENYEDFIRLLQEYQQQLLAD